MRRGSPVLLVLLVATLVASVPPAEGSKTGPERSFYLLSDADGDAFTFFGRYGLEHKNATIRLGIPVGAEDLDVRDLDGRPLHWARHDEGSVEVAVPRDATVAVVVARDLPGPRTGSVAFGDLGPAATLVVALPEGWRPEGRHDTMTAGEVAALGTGSTDGAAFAAFPLPDHRSYHGLLLTGPEEITFERPDGATPAPYALLAVLVGLLALTTVWLMVRVHKSTADPTKPKQMPILEHLEELRRRLMWVVGVLFAGAAFFFTFGFRWLALAGYRVPVPVPSLYDNAAAQVFTWLSRHVVPPNVQVVVVSPWDAVVTQITLSIALAVLVAFPVLFYHLYAYLAPALYPKERRAVFLTVPVIVVLFALGATFGVGLMLPFLVAILYGFAGTLGATAFLNVPDLVALGALNAVVFGLAFELPVVMALLSAIGVVPAASWRRHWRGALIGIVVVSALVTDPTVITQLIVASVLSSLYLIGVGLAAVFEKKAAEMSEARPAAPSEG